jgi:hypothetical protein
MRPKPLDRGAGQVAVVVPGSSRAKHLISQVDRQSTLAKPADGTTPIWARADLGLMVIEVNPSRRLPAFELTSRDLQGG